MEGSKAASTSAWDWSSSWELTFFFFCLVLFFVFRDRASLCNNSGCPGTHTHRDPPASASQVLRLKMCAIAAQPRAHVLSKVRVRKRRSRPDMGSSNLQAHPPATASTTRPHLLILPQTVLPRTKHSNRWYEPMGPFLLRSPWRQWLSSVN